ncbi:MAG: hypothetical protein DIU78_001265 [Pseudomonadota bacterium]|nr:MAG: hypothetical protein DIU78_08945 [Pseudomonadota bacterium]
MLRNTTWFVLALLVSARAGAEPPKAGASAPKSPASQRSPLDVPRLARALESGDEAEMVAALEEIEARGRDGGPAAPLVNALLLRGGSVRVMLAAFKAAAALGKESSSEAVAPYVLHRRPEIRQAAAEALVATGGPAAAAALRRALTSVDPKVRATAARGLGELGAKDAVSDLFVALGKEVPGAASSIASLCAPAECDRLMEYVGKLKFETLEPGFVPLLLRKELPSRNKLLYIDRLRRLATKRSNSVLQTALASLPPDGEPKLRAALQTALQGRPVKVEEDQP